MQGLDRLHVCLALLDADCVLVLRPCSDWADI